MSYGPELAVAYASGSDRQKMNQLIVAGASVRAAAWSALRAGFKPWAVDRFADLDLCRVAETLAVPADDFPHGIPRILNDAPPAPWLFTGALENHPALIERIAHKFPLWGNPPEVLRRVRSPFLLAQSLRRAGLPCPAVARAVPSTSDERRWLCKPRQSAGGRGILSELRGPVRGRYFQEWIDGVPCAAIYLGLADGSSQLVGVTRQLTGESWLHADAFVYCGSIGPLPLTDAQREHYEQIGVTLVRDFSLRGLFGVDCVAKDGVPYPVEVNPRYTASVEILEWAWRCPLLAEHAAVFARRLRLSARPSRRAPGFFAKAIVYADQSCTFPPQGPWTDTLAAPWQPWTMPIYADIPRPGQTISAGEPILTLFTQANSLGECMVKLRRLSGRQRVVTITPPSASN